MRSTKIVEWLLSGRIAWPICCPSERLLILVLPTKNVRTQQMPCILTRFLSSKSPSLTLRGRKLLIQTWPVRKSSFLIGFSNLDCLQSWGHSLRFWNLRPYLGQADSHEWVVSMLVRKHHSMLCLLNQRFLSILRWYWSSAFKSLWNGLSFSAMLGL